MIILCDTRQKKGHHDIKHNQMVALGAKLIFKALSEGDYMLLEKDDITIDTKQNLTELCNNLYSDKNRFMNEIRRCYKKRKKLIILIEHGKEIKTIEDVKKWRSKFSNVSAQCILRRIHEIKTAYNVEFIFCNKCDTGKLIIKLLTQSNIKQK